MECGPRNHLHTLRNLTPHPSHHLQVRTKPIFFLREKGALTTFLLFPERKSVLRKSGHPVHALFYPCFSSKRSRCFRSPATRKTLAKIELLRRPWNSGAGRAPTQESAKQWLRGQLDASQRNSTGELFSESVLVPAVVAGQEGRRNATNGSPVMSYWYTSVT